MTDILCGPDELTQSGQTADIRPPSLIEDAHQSLPFVGRRRERARLEQLLRATGTGRSAALVLRGGPGIGKTALLDHVATTATDHRVVRVRAVAGEADLPFSALHLLCLSLVTELARLPSHHREALEAVVGFRGGRVPDRMLVGTALVTLFSLAARGRPLLCVVDDAQWLDDSSARVLAFAARRLDAGPGALLFACRGDGLDGLPELVLGGLTHGDARTLFERASVGPIDSAVFERIVAEARGNPAVLLESARLASSADFAGGYGVVRSNGVESSALAGLPAESRLLLVLAAAEPLGDPTRLWRAAARLDITSSAAEQLESARLLAFGQWVTFPDPALRSTVYWAAAPAERRRVHAALAAATAEHDRHLWHLGHSLAEPDDAVADALARSAGAAQDRGGLSAMAAFAERAALCAADPRRRAEWAITAADAYHTVGATEAAVRLIATAELGNADAEGRARLKRLRARIRLDADRGRIAVTQLLAAAEDLEGCAPEATGPAYLEALGAAVFTGHLDVVHTALARLANHQPKGTDHLLEGVGLRWTSGFASAVEPLKLALKALDGDHHDDPRTRLLACLVAAELWDDDTWHELTRAQVDRVRATGARSHLPYVLTHRAFVEIHSGQFTTAQALVNEAAATSRTLRTLPFPHAAAVLAAWRGQAHPLLSTVDDTYQRNEGFVATTARYAKALYCNGLGRYSDAVAATRHVIEHDGLELQGWTLVELVEGAVRSGDLDTAAVALDRLSERTCLSGTEWALGMEARSRALLLDGDSAENLYVEAIDRLGRSRCAVHAARAQLIYGEWLRGRGRRIDARTPLQAAHRSFTDIGADSFADRAERELLAAGERRRRRTDVTRGRLTPQEHRIATLARDGRTNLEIGTLLTISPRTVEYHLHKVFTKLGIGSRTELHLVLPAIPAPQGHR